MSPITAKQNLILMGLSSLESVTCSPAERIAYLQAAADMLPDQTLSEQCAVTARCIEEAENAQLRLFRTIRR